MSGAARCRREVVEESGRAASLLDVAHDGDPTPHRRRRERDAARAREGEGEQVSEQERETLPVAGLLEAAHHVTGDPTPRRRAESERKRKGANKRQTPRASELTAPP